MKEVGGGVVGSRDFPAHHWSRDLAASVAISLFRKAGSRCDRIALRRCSFSEVGAVGRCQIRWREVLYKNCAFAITVLGVLVNGDWQVWWFKKRKKNPQDRAATENLVKLVTATQLFLFILNGLALSLVFYQSIFSFRTFVSNLKLSLAQSTARAANTDSWSFKACNFIPLG
jgi:hypothetical protein